MTWIDPTPTVLWLLCKQIFSDYSHRWTPRKSVLQAFLSLLSFPPLSKPLSLSIRFHPLAGLYVTLSKFTHFSMEVLQDLEWYELYQEENTNRLWQLRIICSHRHQNKQFLVGSLASGILEAIGIKSAKGRKLNSFWQYPPVRHLSCFVWL